MTGHDSMLTLLVYLRERKACAEDVIIIECTPGIDEMLLLCLEEWYELRSVVWSGHLSMASLPAQRLRKYMVLLKRQLNS